jgi:hypothetical protein
MSLNAQRSTLKAQSSTESVSSIALQLIPPAILTYAGAVNPPAILTYAGAVKLRLPSRDGVKSNGTLQL